MEANASCPNPLMEPINGAEAVESTLSTVVLLVHYRWVDDNIVTDLRDGGTLLNCWDGASDGSPSIGRATC